MERVEMRMRNVLEGRNPALDATALLATAGTGS
jgi:hypothetical protein